MKDQAADKRSPIIAGALILTAVFLVAFGWLLISAPMPSGCLSGLWLLDRLACLAPNELGDTFAGAFAPVAFVWLVAAVMLQRNELAAQRQELREARSVAEAQVAEARNNVAYMAQQTQLLQLREAQENKLRIDDDFCSYAEALCDYIESSLNIIKVQIKSSDGYGIVIYNDILDSSRSIDVDVFKRLGIYLGNISNCSIESHRENELGKYIRYFGIEELRGISDHLNVLLQRSDIISDPLQIRFQITRSDDCVWRIGLLVQLLEQKGRLAPEIDF